WLWRLVSHVPNLGGVWRGHLSSSFDGKDGRHDVTVRIRQTWTGMIISLETERSRSHSVMGAILLEGAHGPEISYEYLNEPRPGAAVGMHAHRGFARLQIQNDVLDGDYYTGRDRESNGTLHVLRVAE